MIFEFEGVCSYKTESVSTKYVSLMWLYISFLYFLYKYKLSVRCVLYLLEYLLLRVFLLNSPSSFFVVSCKGIHALIPVLCNKKSLTGIFPLSVFLNVFK